MDHLVIGVVRDIAFSSQIRELSTARNLTYRPVRDASQLASALEGGTPVVAIVDLGLTNPDPFAMHGELARLMPSLPVVGYYSHVSHALGERASAANFTHVMTRGEFVHKLHALLDSFVR